MKFTGIGLTFAAVALAACTSPEDAATKASITYAAPFLAVAEDTTGTCASKLKVAEELYKLEEPDFPKVKEMVGKVKGDEKFKAKMKSEVDRIHNGGVAKGYLEKCPTEAAALAKIVANTADAIGVSDVVPPWPGDAKK